MDADAQQLASRAADLILSIRPSIASRLGYRVAAADLLDDDGIAGWDLASRQLLSDLNQLPKRSELEVVVAGWLQRDLQAEAIRWRSMSTLLWQLDWVTRVSGAGPLWQAASATWRRNVDAGLRRHRRGLWLLAERDRRRAEAVASRLESALDAGFVSAPLQELLADAAPGPLGRPGDGPRPLPFVVRAEVAALRQWLGGTSPMQELASAPLPFPTLPAFRAPVMPASERRAGLYHSLSVMIEAGNHYSDDGQCVIRLVPRNSIGAQLAIHAVGLGRIDGAVLCEEHSLLPAAVGQVAQGLSVLSAGVVELANAGPALNERQKEILLHVSAQVPQTVIARRMYVSCSTLKRELRKLRSLVPDRSIVTHEPC